MYDPRLTLAALYRAERHIVDREAVGDDSDRPPLLRILDPVAEVAR